MHTVLGTVPLGPAVLASPDRWTLPHVDPSAPDGPEGWQAPRLCRASGRSAMGLIQLRREDGTRPGRHSENRVDSNAAAAGLGCPYARLPAD
jgi:hypothetical protein